MTEFTPLTSLAGGILIGTSAVLLMLFHGRVAGMTGILAGLLPPLARDWVWRVAFLAGAVGAPVMYVLTSGNAVEISVPVTGPALMIGGILVGAGVIYGNGCPSGHGVCGIARLSRRSIVATITFMLAAIVTVFVLRHVLGG